MNEGIQFSRLASDLLSELQDIVESCDDAAALHSRCIEAILESYSRVDDIVSLRKTDEAANSNTERLDGTDDQIN